MLVSQLDCLGRAGIFAVAAENAAQHVDLVSLGIAFAGTVTLGVGVLRRLDPDRVCGASRRAERTADAFFQPIVVTAQVMTTLVAILERTHLLRVLDCYGFFQNMFKRRRKSAQYVHKSLLNNLFALLLISRGARLCALSNRRSM